MTQAQLEQTSSAMLTDSLNRSQLRSIRPVKELINVFPTTRYYGSKRKLLTWLYSKISGIRFKTVLDAFGGTGSVSQLFRSMQKCVTYNDAFHFNIHVAEALLSETVALPRSALVKKLTVVEPANGIISRNFEGIFFTDDENRWLDGFMIGVNVPSVAGAQRSLLLYLLYQACLKKRPFNLFHRANLNLRTNTEVSRSFGNSWSWEKPFSYHMIKAYDELINARINSIHTTTILPAQNASDIQPGYDLVYLDPPYINLSNHRNRDDYWRKYHFLEGLATYDSWEEKIDSSSKIGMMRTPKHFEIWSRKDTFENALFDLIDLHKSSTVVLSYTTRGYPSQSTITSWFEKLFSDVSIHSRAYTRALSRSTDRELLFVGYPK